MNKLESSGRESPVICTVDVVLLCLQDARLHVALLRRPNAPYEGQLALPGGYVHAQEDLDTADAAARMLKDKTGVVSPYLEQLQTFSGPARDPRGWSLSVAYYALVPLASLSFSEGLELVDVEELRSLPFDHRDIVLCAVSRVRNKSAYSSLPAHLCGDTFTLPELQSVYEAVMGHALNKVSFRRKMDELDVVEPVTGQMSSGGAHRPAQVYRLRSMYRKRLSLSGRSLAS